MNRILVPVLASALLFGCKKAPPDAPQEIVDLGEFLFTNFEVTEDAGKDEVTVDDYILGLENLRDFLADTDLEADPVDRALTLPPLTADKLGDLEEPPNTNSDNQIPVALPGQSIHGVDKSVVSIVEPNQVCIESTTTKWAGREFLTDADCFEDGSCDRLETLTEVRKESFIAKVWYDQYKTYRRWQIDEEGTEVIIGRAWIEKKFKADGGNNSWNQLYSLDVFIDNNKGSLRYVPFWSAVNLSGIGDDHYAVLVRDGLVDALTFGDEFISGNIESCKNDRGLDKPER